MLLAVDTSTRMMGIALFNGTKVLSQDSWVTKQHHTVELAGAVKKNIHRVGCEVEDLDALGIALGPGSFTGLRIGLAFVKGIAFHQQIPLMGIPTLEVVAASQAVKGDRLAAVLEAGRNRYAVGWYQAEKGLWQAEEKIENLSLDELKEKIVGRTQIAGELTPEARKTFEEMPEVILASPVQSLRDPATLAQLAWAKWKSGDEDDPSTLSPFYLHRDHPIPG